jgi:hypothetical protein
MHKRSLAGRLSLVLIFPAALSLGAPAARAEPWLIYHNDRYGTTINYPDIFKAEPPPDAADGRRFKSGDGAEFVVDASYNALDFDVAEYQAFIVKNLAPGATVTYQAQGKDWFVISGPKGAGVFYERHLLTHGAQMTEDFAMFYPAALKATYDPIAARTAKSFRPGSGFQTP